MERRRFLQGAAALAGASLFRSPLERALTGTAWAAVPEGAPRGLHLSFTGDPHTTSTVMWFTNGTTDPGSEVRWTPVPEGVDPATVTLDRVATGTARPTPGVDALAHEVTLAGLAPGSRFAYEVGGAGTWSPTRVGRTVPAAPAPLRIVVFGDHGTSAQARRTTVAALEQDPDLVLIAGDISYANGRQSVWDTYFDELEPLASRVPVLTALGNHDSEDAEDGGFGFDTYRVRFAQPGDELHYSFDAGRIHVCVLEAGEAVADPAQLAGELAFADADLAAAATRRAAGELDHVIVLQHFPLWSNHDSRGNDESLVLAQEPLFLRHGVDLLVVGHNHMYERSLPMVAGEPTTQEPSDYGPDRTGYIEVITGGGGQGLYDFVPADQFQPWSASAHRRHHLTVLDHDGTDLHVTAVATDGPPEELDRFRLGPRRRTLAPVPAVPEAGSPLLLPAAAAALVGAAAVRANRTRSLQET